MLLQCVKCTLYFRSFPKMRIHKKGPCADKPKTNVMDEVKEEIKEEVEDTVMDEANNDTKDDILDDTKYENKDESMVTVEEKNAPEDSTKIETKSKVETKSSVYDPEEEAKKNPWNYQEVDLKDEDNQESDSLFRKDDVNKQEPNSDSVDKKDSDNEQPIKEESKEKEKVPGVYKPAPVVKDEDSDDEYEPISDDSAPDDDDVEAVLGFGLMRKKTFKPKKRRMINKEMLSTKAVYITLASGQRVKKFTNQRNERFVPRKPWIPYRSQVSVAQVCKYLETKDVVILSSPALRHKCKDRTYFDSIARPLLRRANPDTHPLVLDTLIRAKWFEIMNIEDEDVGPEKQEKQEGGMKRKLSSMGPAGSDRVKRIKLNVKKNTM